MACVVHERLAKRFAHRLELDPAEQVGEEAALGLAAGKAGFVGVTAPSLWTHPDILKRTRRGRTIQGRAYDHGGLLLCAKL